MISPVRRSSALRTGQELTSALASVTSSLVPRILCVVFSGSMGPNNGTSVLYRFGGESVVGRSSWMDDCEKTTLAASLSIFFRKKEAITLLGVW